MDQVDSGLLSTGYINSHHSAAEASSYFRIPPARIPQSDDAFSPPPSPSPAPREYRSFGQESTERDRHYLRPGNVRSRIRAQDARAAANAESASSTRSSPGDQRTQTYLRTNSSTESSPGAQYFRSASFGSPSSPSLRHKPRPMKRRRNTLPKFSPGLMSSPNTTPKKIGSSTTPVSSHFTRRVSTLDQRSPDTIDHKIATLLEKGPGLPNRRGKSPFGVVYVLTRLESKSFVKIGKFGGDVVTRIGQISPGNCYGHLRAHPDERDRPFEHYDFAEKIVRAELYNIRHESRFSPITPQNSPASGSPAMEEGRTEWYKLQPYQALDVVVRWRDWLDDCEPYDKNGHLTGYWKQVISGREKYDRGKHGDIASRWSVLLKKPHHYQLTWYYATRWARFICQHLLAVFQALPASVPSWLLIIVCLQLFTRGGERKVS